jgi:hypothetical protein
MSETKRAYRMNEPKNVQRCAMILKMGVMGFILGTGFVAEAKDLTSRLGVGIKNNNSQDLPALATVYYPNSDFGVTGSLGIDTQKNASKFAINGGVRRILFREERMNFYFGGQLGLVNYEGLNSDTPAVIEKQSGFELAAMFGAEFFFAGLDSLAFTFEGGVGIASLQSVRFRTFGDHPLRAGMIFYF